MLGRVSYPSFFQEMEAMGDAGNVGERKKEGAGGTEFHKLRWEACSPFIILPGSRGTHTGCIHTGATLEPAGCMPIPRLLSAPFLIRLQWMSMWA